MFLFLDGVKFIQFSINLFSYVIFQSTTRAIVYHFMFISRQYEDSVTKVENFHNEDKGFMVLACDVFDLPIGKDVVH